MSRRRNLLISDTNEEVRKHTPAELSFDDAVSKFLQESKLRNLSRDTLKYYAMQLRIVDGYLKDAIGTVDVAQITKQDIREHVILRMMDAGLKETTINSRLRAVRAFFNFLAREALIVRNPMKTVSLVKEKQDAIETFSAEQVRLLFRAPDMRTFTGNRDYTMIMLMLETGVRLKELVGIKTHHISLDEGLILITEGKGNKERLVPIQKSMRAQLVAYLDLRGDVESEYVFLNIDNGQLSKRQWQIRLKAYGESVGIKNVRVSPHTFRHTFAKMAVQNGANIFELQKMLGHSTLDMVRRYVNLYSADVARGHAKFSPIEKLNA